MKQYSLTNNIMYMLKNWKDWQPKSLIYSLIRIPAIIVLPAITALIPKIMIDCINQNVSIKKMSIYIALVSICIAFFSWISPYMYEKVFGASQIIKKKYSILLFKKTMEMDYSILESYDGKEKLEKAKIFTEGYNPSSSYFCNAIVMLITNVLGIVSYAALLIRINFMIILFILITCLLEFFYIIYFEKKRRMFIDKESKFNVVYKYFLNISHNVSAAKDIRVFQFTSLFKKILKKTSDSHIKLLNKYTQQSNRVSLSRGIISMIRDAITYIYLTYLLVNQKLSISNYVFYFGIITGFSSWLIGIAEQYKELLFCSNCCNCYRDFINLGIRQGQKTFDKTVINSTKSPLIEIKNLSYKYDNSEEYVLSNLNFTINPGENIAIVGENGAGKTTFIKILMNLYSIPKKSIFFNGQDVTTINEKEYNHFFSTIFQEYYFFPMSIAENICLCEKSDINYEYLYSVLKQLGLYEKIMSLPQKLDTKMIKKVYADAIDFSGGEKQKLLIARALYRNSPILILDEPTASLDPISENSLYEKYGELSQNKTTIFVSHRLSSTMFCDKIMLLKNGKIIEKGTHEELMIKKGDYYRMFNMQSYYYKNGGEDV